MNECERCHKKIKDGDVFSIEDEMVCEDCLNKAIDLAEYLYESQKENEATGN